VPFKDDIKINTFAPTAAGTSTITQTTGLDMAGYDGAVFIIRLGTPSATNTLKVSQCDAVSGTYSDLASTATSSGSDGPLILEINRPKEQFLKYVVTRAVSTTIDTVAVIQYGARTRPVTQPTGSVVETYVNPSEGTA
jgi:hypothetical protein